MAQTNELGTTFGGRLLKPVNQSGLLGVLAFASEADTKLLRGGSPENGRRRINKMQADGDMHATVADGVNY